MLVGSFHHVLPIAIATANAPVSATSRLSPMTASTSGTSRTLPVIVSVEPAIAMSSAASAIWRPSATASRAMDRVGVEAGDILSPAILARGCVSVAAGLA